VSKKNIRVLVSLLMLRVTFVFSGDDATFDFTNDSLDRVQDVQSRRDDTNFFMDNLPLDARQHRDEQTFTTTDKGLQNGTTQSTVRQEGTSENPMVVDPELLEQDVSPRDRAALKALQDDHVFF